MARLIKVKKEMSEGYIFNRWLYNRIIKHNKNVLCAITGATGSSKSYQDLRRAELWYKYHFKKEFPVQNICFSVADAVRRISKGDLKRGEIIILEEAGVNLGSLDFQSRVAKLFTYVLQSFRSMNIAIFFNLPYLNMLNKQARYLIHVHFETCGIDHKKSISKSKGFFRQVNQATGKIYSKYLRVKSNGKVRIVKRFNYNLPSKWLIKAYEQKKFKFVNDLTADFSEELDRIERDKIRKMARNDLTDKQIEVHNLLTKNKKPEEIAELLGTTSRNIYYLMKKIKKRGYEIKIDENAIGNEGYELQKPISAPY